MSSGCYREWEVVHKSPTGEYIRIITDAYTVRCNLRLNSPGVIILELPSTYCAQTIGGYAASDFNEDDRIELWVTVGGVKTLFGETCFFVSRIASERNEDGLRQLVIEADSALILTERRINAYNSDSGNSDLVERPVTDQMKFLMRANYGAAAESYSATPDPVRTAIAAGGWLTIEADNGVGPAWRDDIENSNVLDVLQNASDFAFGQGTPIFFDIVQTATFGNLEFRTYANERGIDRTSATGGTNAFVASPDNDTIADYSLEFTWQDYVNRVYAGGQGQGAARPYQVADEAGLAASLATSPWRLREQFLGANSDDATDILNEAIAELQANAAVVQATGTIGETPAFCFHQDYSFGDRISVFLEGNLLDVHISDVSVELVERGEKIDVRFTTELNTRLQGIGSVLQQVARLSRNIRRLDTREYV